MTVFFIIGCLIEQLNNLCIHTTLEDNLLYARQYTNAGVMKIKSCYSCLMSVQ